MPLVQLPRVLLQLVILDNLNNSSLVNIVKSSLLLSRNFAYNIVLI